MPWLSCRWVSSLARHFTRKATAHLQFLWVCRHLWLSLPFVPVYGVLWSDKMEPWYPFGITPVLLISPLHTARYGPRSGTGSPACVAVSNRCTCGLHAVRCKRSVLPVSFIL